MTGQALVVQADALRLPLPDESVDLVITSPPYFALRAYDAGPGQLGSEATPQAYLEALWQATREMARVLKPSGSIFVNLGDKYATAFGPNSTAGKTNWSAPGTRYDGSQRSGNRSTNGFGVREKSLLLLPERYRIGCVDHLGLIARAVIVWNKPNGLPESVTDRVRRSHEDWVHLTKQPRYYAAVDEVRIPQKQPDDQRWLRTSNYPAEMTAKINSPPNPLGALPGSVWSIPSEPLRLPEHLGVDHYAAFPSEWPRRLILGWSPPGVCVACGQGRWPVVDKRLDLDHMQRRDRPGFIDGSEPNGNRRGINADGPNGRTEATILGYACACTPHTNHPGTGEYRGPDQREAEKLGTYSIGFGHGGMGARPRVGPWREYHLAGWTPPPTRPAIVCDPFGGTGTVAGVARQLGRVGISVDLSHAYGRAARYRIFQSGDFGKAEGRTWRDRQGSLL